MEIKKDFVSQCRVSDANEINFLYDDGGPNFSVAVAISSYIISRPVVITMNQILCCLLRQNQGNGSV